MDEAVCNGLCDTRSHCTEPLGRHVKERPVRRLGPPPTPPRLGWAVWFCRMASSAVSDSVLSQISDLRMVKTRWDVLWRLQHPLDSYSASLSFDILLASHTSLQIGLVSSVSKASTSDSQSCTLNVPLLFSACRSVMTSALISDKTFS